VYLEQTYVKQSALFGKHLYCHKAVGAIVRVVSWRFVAGKARFGSQGIVAFVADRVALGQGIVADRVALGSGIMAFVFDRVALGGHYGICV
jgi:hypothetical protein